MEFPMFAGSVDVLWIDQVTPPKRTRLQLLSLRNAFQRAPGFLPGLCPTIIAITWPPRQPLPPRNLQPAPQADPGLDQEADHLERREDPAWNSWIAHPSGRTEVAKAKVHLEHRPSPRDYLQVNIHLLQSFKLCGWNILILFYNSHCDLNTVTGILVHVFRYLFISKYDLSNIHQIMFNIC